MPSRPMRLLTICALAVLASSASAQQVQALKFARVVDGNGMVTPGGVIIVSGDTVLRVQDARASIPRDAKVVDLTKYSAVPGMIDVHTHITYSYDPESGLDPWNQGRRELDVIRKFQLENMRHTLESGVTTIRDLGASNYVDIALRDSVNRGVYVGPRMFVAGVGLSRRRLANDSLIVAAVKAQVDHGADYIKMYGSTGSGADVTGTETFPFEAMKVAVDAAKQYGKRIAIHSYGPLGGHDAVFAGATTLEHSIDLDDATLSEMVKRGTFYVPTIDHNRYYAEYAKDYRYTPQQVAALDSFRLLNLATAKRAFQAGVKFGMGSDAVFHMFGQNTRELGFYTQIGMTPAQALATATVNGAAILGMEAKLGRIAHGYYADIVAVDGDPTTDIGVVINRVKWVMKGGAVVVDLADR
jgi:imidazolonepropionase-like amidohydrolase